MPEIRAYYINRLGDFIPINKTSGTIEEENLIAQRWAIDHNQESVLGYMKGEYLICRLRYQPEPK